MPRPDLLDPKAHPDRDSLIRAMVVDLGWPAAKAGECFDLSARQVQRIAGPASASVLPGEGPGLVRREAPRLTLEEGRRMMNDYLRDPYIRPAEVAAAREWIEGQTSRVGVA